MVHTPYDNDDSIDDPKKAKLRDQAQQQFINQLQQRIANLTTEIEGMQEQVSQVQQTNALKDQELKEYSSRVEEERMWFERDKKARDDREHELNVQIKEKEAKIKELEEASSLAKIQGLESQPSQESMTSPVSNQINDYIETLMAYFQNPTHDDFVQALRDLIRFCGSEGTDEQKVLGFLLKADMPKTEEELTQNLHQPPQNISKAIFRLTQKQNIKKVGRGYAVISSEFAEMADVSQNWKSLSPPQIFENLMSVIYVEADKQELITAFTNARDALMEMNSLSTSNRHEMSQTIEKIKRYPIEKNELVESIQKWKANTTE